ncbi:MAG: hypothetical protein PQJ58_17190 [Spirochaetales bacterium]|nr:hypothetical protein [Spirochaetales bacterium]
MAFGRKVVCQIGPPGEVGVKITDLKIAFEVKKTDQESLNEALVTIYNLSDQTISQISGKNKALVLRAGYEDEGVKGLFFGTVKDVKTSKGGADRETVITAYDGYKNGRDRVISVSYSPGIERQAVLRDLLQALGLPCTGCDLVTGSFPGGFSFIGKVLDGLARVIATTGGLSWTIQNESFLVYKAGEPTEFTGLFLSPETGLIGSPEDITEEPEDGGEAVKRYRVTSLLFPELLPGSRIKVKSKKLEGYCKVEHVVFTGCNLSESFQAVSEVVPV